MNAAAILKNLSSYNRAIVINFDNAAVWQESASVLRDMADRFTAFLDDTSEDCTLAASLIAYLALVNIRLCKGSV